MGDVRASFIAVRMQNLNSLQIHDWTIWIQNSTYFALSYVGPVLS